MAIKKEKTVLRLFTSKSKKLKRHSKKRTHNKNSKLYSKRYKGQGR